MKPPKPRQRARAPDAPPSNEVRVVRERAHEPRLPHENDESADRQHQATPDSVGRKAYQDVKEGRVDTDRGPALQELGRRLPSHGLPAPARRRRSR